MAVITPPYAQDYDVVAAAPYQTQTLAYRQLSITTVTTLAAALAAATPPYPLTGLERSAVITVETNGIRIIDDGQTPTTTYGDPISAGASERFTGNFAAAQIVSQNGTATVNVRLEK